MTLRRTNILQREERDDQRTIGESFSFADVSKQKGRKYSFGKDDDLFGDETNAASTVGSANDHGGDDRHSKRKRPAWSVGGRVTIRSSCSFDCEFVVLVEIFLECLRLVNVVAFSFS